MTEITGGSVKFLKRLNKGNYEHEEVQFEIGFGGQTSEEVLKNAAFAGELAKAQTFYLLGLEKKPATPAASVPVVDSPAAVVPTKGAEPAPEGTRKAGRPPGALNKARASLAEQAAPTVANAAAITDDEPAQVSAATITDDEPASTSAAAITDEDENIFAAQAPPVTDAALTKALQDHNAVVKNPVAIRELIGQFVAPPGQASDIPQARRPEFITKLKLIGPKAG